MDAIWEFPYAGLTEKIIGCAIEVHRHLGPGVYENIYEDCLSHELGLAGIRHERQLCLGVEYKGKVFDRGYKLDILAENLVIVELKVVEKLAPVHDAQILSYMKLTGKRVGLLVNFNEPRLVDGIRRFAK